MKILKKIGIFFGAFLLYHIVFSSFFPVDESNTLQAPDWYVPLGMGIAIVTAILLPIGGKRKEFSRDIGSVSSESPSINGLLEKPLPSSKKKQMEMANTILGKLDLLSSSLSETETVSDFIDVYDEVLATIAILAKLEKISLSPSPIASFAKHQNDYQWHLCDAIVRIKEDTLRDIKEKYRNSREFQAKAAKAFEDDVLSVQTRFSEGTHELAMSAIDEVRIAAKLDARQVAETSHSAQTDLFARYGGVDSELLSIDLMEGHAFEHWCAQLLTDLGYTDVSVTRGSGDQGVDVLAQKGGIRYAIQCKCYTRDLDNTPIQEVNAGKTMPEYHCQIGVVMTNRHFTQGAKDLAYATGVLLWDRDWIADAIRKRNAK